MKIKTHTCTFVLCSDLFRGYRKLASQMSESEADFTWGSNNRSMVTVEVLVNHMDSVGIEYSKKFAQRCQEVGLQTYVDLEN